MKFGADREVEDKVGDLTSWKEEYFENSGFEFCFQMSSYWVAQAALKPSSCLGILNSGIAAIPLIRVSRPPSEVFKVSFVAYLHKDPYLMSEQVRPGY